MNNSGATLNSISLSSHTDAFAFDGDGIDTYVSPNPQVTGNPDTTGYGGPIGYFTGINATFTAGTVNFFGGVSDGSNTYFSLEDQLAAVGGGGLQVGGVPLPASAPMFGGALLALGVVGYGMKRRAKTGAAAA